MTTQEPQQSDTKSTDTQQSATNGQQPDQPTPTQDPAPPEQAAPAGQSPTESPQQASPTEDQPRRRQIKIGSQRDQYRPARTPAPAAVERARQEEAERASDQPRVAEETTSESTPETSAAENAPAVEPPAAEKPAAAQSAEAPQSSAAETTEEKPPTTTGAASETTAAPPEMPQPAPPPSVTESGSTAAADTESSAASAEEAAAEEAAAEEKVKETAPSQGATSPKAAPSVPDRPGIRGRLSADLEKEIDDALGEMSIDDVLAGEKAEKSGAALEPESKHPAAVMKIHRDDVFLKLGERAEASTSLRNFKEPPSVGDVIEVTIERFNAEDGLYEVSVPGAAADVGDWSEVREGMVVEARITGSNTGGLECAVGSIRGFIPASQIDVVRVEDFGQYANQKLNCVITQADPARNNLILSRRAVIEREQEETRRQKLEELQVGQMFEGVVRKIMDFGAFVDIGGVDGLVHVSQLSWDRVNHPSDVLEEGQKIQVKVVKVDKTSGKIGLSYRETIENPWTTATQKYPAGAIVDATITKIMDFGAFARLEPGIEGLIHVSELATHRVSQVGAFVKEGQEVKVKILAIDTDAQRMQLSMKAISELAQAEKAAETAREEEGDSSREPVPQVTRKLKGGKSGKSGGEQFGLKW